MKESELIRKREDGKVLFGSYPQSEVKDADLLARLIVAAGDLPKESPTHRWTSFGFRIEGKNDRDVMWYIDLAEGGERYRGVYIDEPRHGQAGEYPEWNPEEWPAAKYGKGSLCFFRYEPIAWRVWEEGGDGALLFSEKSLDAREFSNLVYPAEGSVDEAGSTRGNDYEHSDIRSFLNGAFFDTAFDAEEKKAIVTVRVDNSVPSTFAVETKRERKNKFACEDTLDRVFLPSIREITDPKYGFRLESEADPARVKEMTDYAYCIGGFPADGVPAETWWLRSPDYDCEDDARYVFGSGRAYYYDEQVDWVHGVVPLVRVRP